MDSSIVIKTAGMALGFGGVLYAAVGDFTPKEQPKESRADVVAWGASGGAGVPVIKPKVSAVSCSANAVFVDVAADLVAVSQEGGSDCVVSMGETLVGTGDRQTLCATGGTLSISDAAGLVSVGGTIRLGANDCITLSYATTGLWTHEDPLQFDNTLCAGCRVNRTVTGNTAATIGDDIIRVIRPGLSITNTVTFPTCDAAMNGKTWEIVPEGGGLGVVQIVAGVGNLLRGLTTLNILGTSAVTVTCDGAGGLIARP